jgi:8-oxo-dGTP pyrophosphatase MutT (NUDIX family)
LLFATLWLQYEHMSPERTNPLLESERWGKPVAWTFILATGPKGEYPQLYILTAEYLNMPGIAFPGGKKERNENYSETAARELMEETDFFISPKILQTCGSPFKLTRGKTIYEVQPHFLPLFFDLNHRFTQSEPEKLGPWKWTSLHQLLKHAAQGNLPCEAIREEWIETAVELAYRRYHPEAYRFKRIPAWYMNECKAIGEESLFLKFRKEILTPPPVSP